MFKRKAGKSKKIAWCVLVTCILAWPVTSMTVFKGEQQGILALSWLALILTAVLIVIEA